MRRFKNGDLVTNLQSGYRCIILDSTLGWVNGRWCIGVADLEGEDTGRPYAASEENFELVEGR